MEKIGQLYAIEAEARRLALSHEDRKALRQERSIEILAEMKVWLDRKFVKVLPKSSISQYKCVIILSNSLGGIIYRSHYTCQVVFHDYWNIFQKKTFRVGNQKIEYPGLN